MRPSAAYGQEKTSPPLYTATVPYLPAELSPYELLPEGFHVSQPDEWTENFRYVRHTTQRGQEVEMTLASKQVVTGEIHHDNDQLFIVMSGTGTFDVVDEQKRYVIRAAPGTRVYVNAGTWHEIRAGAAGMTLLSVYMPAHHAPDTVNLTDPDAPAVKRKEFAATTTPTAPPERSRTLANAPAESPDNYY
jgi:mannose-6-phosphate isomerase-like protein (cupin superfamily)